MVEATVSLFGDRLLLVPWEVRECTCLPATIRATESPFSQKRSCSRLLFFLKPLISQEEIWASRSFD